MIYRALFQAAWGTLDAFGHDAKHLDGEFGMTGVLHTWGQSLCQHVHLHCLVPGGALADDGTWLPAKGSSLFPVRALSRHFRARFVSALRSAAQAGELTGIDPGAVSALLDALMGEQWVVFATPCLEHTESLIGYLARYTHRIAISNARILGLNGDKVHLSLPRLPRRRAQDAGAGGRQAAAPLAAARAAQGAAARAPLRASGQALSGAAPGADPEGPCGART